MADSKLKSTIHNPAELLDYLQEKGKKHNCYKYYSTHKRIEQTIQQRAIYLTRGEDWNDREDGRSFSTSRNGYTRFGKCFSFSRSENVAMWMLYGGTDHEGAMLDLTQGIVKNILATKKVQLGFFSDNGKFKCIKSIDVDNGCSLFFLDVLYIGEDGGKYAAKRSDERVDGLNCPPSEDGLLTKAYPWSYENEVRLIFEAPNDLIPAAAKCIRVSLECESNALRNRAYSAPNSEPESYKPSKLNEKMNWDICRGCKRVKQP